MIYLSSFRLSKRKVNNPNIYPYNVFRDKYIEPFVFRPITVLYGNNGSGKSTLLNIIANCLQRKRQTMRQSLKSTPPIIGDVASCIRPEDYLTMA